MTFENVAYLFDTTVLGIEKNSSVYGVLSFVGSSVYIPAYVKETINRFNCPVSDEDGISELLNDPEKSEFLFNLLIKLYDDIEKLGITSFFIEKDYSAFIYLMGLMVTSVNVEDSNFRKHLDNLYYAYQTTYSDGIKRDGIDETVTLFNQRIQHLLLTQKEHLFFKNLLSENGRKLSEQIIISKVLERDTSDDFMVADYFFYAKQLIDNYKEKNVHTIYTSDNSAKRFTEATGRFFMNSEVSLNVISCHDDDYLIVSQLARLILLISNHYVGKIVKTKEIKDLDEIDKYLFVIVWMILHGGDNNMFINGRSYEVIREIFLSLKKDMDI